ncbi:unnamed protein product [Eruca vesicaria subsp. sativa]|uniref:Uncharacterized protein n=1 Tax=Eruca vesicaria subsp. sativa TaxID=29727 RepID=A0ABC8JC63_ERUVS|nr:unnamed protein product [Eruca vesicaria subsp. sativa]
MAKAREACELLKELPEMKLGHVLEEIGGILPGHRFASGLELLLSSTTRGFQLGHSSGFRDMEPLRTSYMQSEEHESNNQSVVYIGVDNTLAPVIGFEDKIREDAAQVVENLT